MRHLGTRILHTPRLTLRPLTPEDAPAMFANWANDPEVTRWLRWDPHPDVDFTRRLLTAWAELYPNPDHYEWGVVETATGTLFGTICLMNPALGGGTPHSRWNNPGGTTLPWEPGYCYGKAFWGKGYATEALQAVVDFWFGQVGGSELACCHAIPNTASGHVMQKVGFVYNRDATDHKFDGTPVAVKYYTLPRAVWEKTHE